MATTKTPFQFSFTIDADPPAPADATDGPFEDVEGAIRAHQAEWKAALVDRKAEGSPPPHALAEALRSIAIDLIRAAAAAGPWSDWPVAHGTISVTCDLAPERAKQPPKADKRAK